MPCRLQQGLELLVQRNVEYYFCAEIRLALNRQAGSVMSAQPQIRIIDSCAVLILTIQYSLDQLLAHASAIVLDAKMYSLVLRLDR